MRRLATAVLFMLTLAANTYGGLRAVAENFVTLGDWDFVPTLDGARVESFVVLLDPSLAVGDNITAVWFRRTDDEAWKAYAWSDATNLQAIAYVKATLGLPDSSDILWPDADAQQGVDPALGVAPDAFAKGVFADDAFAPVIEAIPEPGPMIGGLAGAGYPAAAIPIQTTRTTCSQDRVLTTLAAMVEADIGTDAGGTLMATFEVPYAECDLWRSLAAPLDGDGLWLAPDLTDYLDQTTAIDPATAWQSVAAGAVFGGPQTVVIDAGGTDAAGVPFVAAKLVIAVQDMTPPTLDVGLLGDGMLPMVSPGGLDYFVAPVTITAEPLATDNVDGGVVAAALNVDISVDCIGPGPVVLSEPGYYTLHARVTDSSGNTTYASRLFEVRDRYNLEAVGAIESLTVTPGSPTDTVEATVLLTSEMFEAKDVNLATFALWLRDAAGEAIGTGPLVPAAGYVAGGAYDPALVDLDAGVWRLAVAGEVPSGAIGQPGVQFSITGSGLHGTPEAFDLLALDAPFAADAAAEATLLSLVTPMSTADVPPELQPVPPCVWRSQFEGLDEDSYFGYWSGVCGARILLVKATPSSISGQGSASDSACWFTSNPSDAYGASSGGRFTLEPRTCCVDCTIHIDATPTFQANASIDPPAQAIAGGRIKVAGPCGNSALARGGVAVGDFDTETLEISIGEYEIPITVSSASRSESKAFVDTFTCVQHECRATVTFVTSAYISITAAAVWNNLFASAHASLRNSALNLVVTPFADPGCGVTNDGDPLRFPAPEGDCPPEGFE